MTREWTENQKNAINARGNAVCVSAAAGSGKTAVLTERVKNLLCDTENPVNVNELLVVTFTNAAAGEMRDRIAKSMRDAVRASGENASRLKSQLTLLPTADICTIDSFCGKLVRENFHLASVSPDYSLMEENDAFTLMTEIAEEIITGLYEEDDEAFKALTKMFLTERDDSLLSGVIISLYKYSRSYPYPSEWIESLCDSFKPDITLTDTQWSDIIFDDICLAMDYHIASLNTALELMGDDKNFSAHYVSAFEATINNLADVKMCALLRDWDKMLESISDSPVRRDMLSGVRNVDTFVRDYAKNALTAADECIKAIWNRTLPTVSQHKEDCEALFPIVRKLCSAVESFSVKLSERKSEENRYTFDDILHKAVDLLTVKKENTWERTALANELSARYKEILIDEYQDTNEAQNMIFEAVSRNKTNLYCVGDVKQSIYRFRLASPSLFLQQKRALPAYSKESNSGRIILDKNFRSRKGITDAVNFVFSAVMSEDAGDIAYNDEECLTAGAVYPVSDSPETEIHFIKTVKNVLAAEALSAQADAVARYISDCVKNKQTVTDRDGKLRPVRYGDFCVLLRSLKGRASVYGRAMEEAGVPAAVSNDGAMENSREIAFLLSLLRVIENPLASVPLAAVMLSPVFGFSPDELSAIRLENSTAPLFNCLTEYAKGNKKAAGFLNKLRLYRNISSACPVDEFVEFIIDDTAVTEIYFAFEAGENRRNNIKSFSDIAVSFSDNGRSGLGSFLRYIDSMIENGNFRNTVSNEGGDRVSILSIHKSKGLEYPVVILADCGRDFNRRDSYGTLTVSRESGLGLKIRDDRKVTRYHTLSSAAGEKAICRAEISEELRVLYVAMTRAREKLVFFGTLKEGSAIERIQRAVLSANKADRTVLPFAVLNAGSMAEWISFAFAFHPDCGTLRNMCGLNSLKTVPTDFKVKCEITEYEEQPEVASEEKSEHTINPDFSVTEEINNRLSYSYAYESLSGVLSKRTASSAENNGDNERYYFKTKPAFMGEQLSGAVRGTAVHKFFELCDFKNAKSDVQKEKLRLAGEKRMTEDELSSVEPEAVRAFFETEVATRLLKSEKVYKEYTFSFLSEAGELYKELPDNVRQEKIVVQGKADCFFTENDGIVLIDYKTDSVTDEKVLVNTYASQLAIYKKALLECTGLPVKEAYLYSFKLKKMIPV